MSKKIEIYDPAMCCESGVCGPSVDTELLRVATVVESLKKQGVDITRHNLASDPQAFIANPHINSLLMEDAKVLPVTLVDGEVVKTKAHLTNDEFTEHTGIVIITAPAAEPCCSAGEKGGRCADNENKAGDAPCCCGDSGCC